MEATTSATPTLVVGKRQRGCRSILFSASVSIAALLGVGTSQQAVVAASAMSVESAGRANLAGKNAAIGVINDWFTKQSRERR